MTTNRKYFIAILIVAVTLLAACGNSSDKSKAESNIESSSSKSTQSVDNNEIDNKTENASESADNSELNNQEDNSSNSSLGSTTSNQKDEYLKQLNEMEEADRNEEAKTTMVEMEEQEAERYKKWDESLNEIYGVLMEQLNTEQRDQLREEQRKWIEHRDATAKESSLKYKGGSTESLEYVATQASLTKERCYELIAKYMK